MRKRLVLRLTLLVLVSMGTASGADVFFPLMAWNSAPSDAATFRKPPRRVQMVSPYTGQLTDFAGEQQWLAAGQGTLLKLE